MRNVDIPNKQDLPAPPANAKIANMSDEGHAFHGTKPWQPGTPTMQQQPQMYQAQPMPSLQQQQMMQQPQQFTREYGGMVLNDYDDQGNPTPRQAMPGYPPLEYGRPMDQGQPEQQPYQAQPQFQPPNPAYQQPGQPALPNQPQQQQPQEQMVQVQLPSGMVVLRPMADVVKGYLDYEQALPTIEGARRLEEAAASDPQWWENNVVPKVTGQAWPQASQEFQMPAIELPEGDDEESEAVRAFAKPLVDALQAQGQQLNQMQAMMASQEQQRLVDQRTQDENAWRADLEHRVRTHPGFQGLRPELVDDAVYAIETAYRSGRYAGSQVQDHIERYAQMFSQGRQQDAQAQYHRMQNLPNSAYMPPGGEAPVPRPPATPTRFDDGSWENELMRRLTQAREHQQMQQGGI